MQCNLACVVLCCIAFVLEFVGFGHMDLVWRRIGLHYVLQQPLIQPHTAQPNQPNTTQYKPKLAPEPGPGPEHGPEPQFELRLKLEIASQPKPEPQPGPTQFNKYNKIHNNNNRYATKLISYTKQSYVHGIGLYCIVWYCNAFVLGCMELYQNAFVLQCVGLLWALQNH